VRFIIPFPPGGSTDPMARFAAGKLTERLGQQVIVENRPGASGIIATDYVARAKPDGYTLSMGVTSARTMNQTIYKALPYQPADFVPVTQTTAIVFAMVVTPSLPAPSVAALIALAASPQVNHDLWSIRTVEWFVGLATTLLACQKLQDVEAFATMFLGYSLIGRRWVPYAYLYPYGEALAGLVMIAHGPAVIGAPVAALIGVEGSISVIYAVYVQKRELKCACVGGGSNVPLGFVSLTENLVMIAMAVWMIAGPS